MDEKEQLIRVLATMRTGYLRDVLTLKTVREMIDVFLIDDGDALYYSGLVRDIELDLVHGVIENLNVIIERLGKEGKDGE